MTDTATTWLHHPAERTSPFPIEDRASPQRFHFSDALVPLFPRFRPLEITDQESIERWTRRFPPFSDFNFVSLWSWNTDRSFEISRLNGNLVVRFKDYGSDERFVSFLGHQAVEQTAAALIQHEADQGRPARLRLIPDAAARELRGSQRLQVEPTREDFDYVLSTESWASMAGSHFRNKRNAIHRLEREPALVFRALNLSESDVQRQITDLFSLWTIQHGLAGSTGVINESFALQHVFDLQHSDRLLTFGVSIGDEMVGFSINETLSGGYAMGHYWKADDRFPGLYALMLRETCRWLLQRGYRFLNIMQDLGDPGLERAKLLYRPDHFLRKYSIGLKPSLQPVPVSPDFADLRLTEAVS